MSAVKVLEIVYMKAIGLPKEYTPKKNKIK